jgi:hypothetical protein
LWETWLPTNARVSGDSYFNEIQRCQWQLIDWQGQAASRTGWSTENGPSKCSPTNSKRSGVRHEDSRTAYCTNSRPRGTQKTIQKPSSANPSFWTLQGVSELPAVRCKLILAPAITSPFGPLWFLGVFDALSVTLGV